MGDAKLVTIYPAKLKLAKALFFSFGRLALFATTVAPGPMLSQVNPPSPRPARPTAPVEVRVRNASPLLLKSVTVEGFDYGDIRTGQATAYRKFDAIETPSLPVTVSLIAGSIPMKVAPFDYEPKRNPRPGRFTYVLSIVKAPDRERLVVELVEDPR